MIRVVSLAAVFTVAAHAFAESPLSPEEALRSFELADDLAIELVAAEPLVASPCAMAFDERGRLFVVENRGYPNHAEPPQGIVALLDDTDGDGRMDQRTVFAGGLAFPNGVMPWRGGVFVTAAPDVLYLKDTDGDGAADERRMVLTGFDTTKSTQLRVNAPLLGPDGWVWLASGLTGGKIRNPAHPEFGELDLKTDLRFDPHTGRFEPIDGRSQYGHSFGENGERFICMNRIQVQHVVLSSKHLRRNPHLAFSETVQNCPELVPNPLLRGGGGAARIFPLSKNLTTADSHAGTFSAACGVFVWRGGNLPDSYRTPHPVAFSCEPTGNLVHADRLERHDSTFAAVPLFKDREFLASRDDWFRPVFLSSGPDGALYIADMVRKVIEHPDYLPEAIRKRTDFDAGRQLGRIWRVRAKSPGAARVESLASAEALLHRDAWTRDTAWRLIVEKVRAEKPIVPEPAKERDRVNPRWFPIRHLFSPLSDAELEAALAQPFVGTEDAVLDILIDDLAAGRRGPELLVKMGAKPYKQWSFDRTRYAIALGYVRDDAVAIPLLAKAAVSWTAERWKNATVVSSAAGRELALLRAMNTVREEKWTIGSFEPLTSLLVETLGRADAARGIDSISEVLSLCAEDDWSTARVGIAAAYAHGRGVLLDPANPHIAEMLRKTRWQTEDSGFPRATSIPLLAHVPWEHGGASLLRLAKSGNRDAIKALARWEKPEIARTLLSANWALFSPQVRADLLGVCLGRPSYFAAVLDAIDAGIVPLSTLTAQQKKQLRESKAPEIRERTEKLFVVADDDRQTVFEKAKAALALTPNPPRGREVFKNFCGTCHRLEREGVAVGPDLFDMRNQPKESILLHIVNPDAEIAPGFAAWIVETKDGRSLAGIVTSETPASISLRQPGGAEETITRTAINSLTASMHSLMPPGLEAAMTPQQLADLLAWLRGED